MSPDDVLTTSPLLFGYRGRDGRLAGMSAIEGPRFRLTGTRAAQIVSGFLEPCSVAQAQERGFTADELAQALEAGILIHDGSAGPMLWEQSGWSRAAYLLFSQMDIPYREPDAVMGDRPSITAERRAAVSAYQRDGEYEAPGMIAGGRTVALPVPSAATCGLEVLTERRSARAFAPSPPTADQMAGVLWTATESSRLVAADRAAGDPFRLLNSMFSWAHLFVVVQDVEDLPPGVYEYDWREHRLVGASAPVADDAALLACVQGQRWVLGAGFVVFVVAELRGYAWLYRHSRAYLHVLTQLGELGQELLMAATARSLVGWTSPAVHESRAAALLGIPDQAGLDVLSMVKLGSPLARRHDDERS